MDFNDIIKSYDTPLFIYDCDVIKKRISYLRNILCADICYAIKANTFVIKEIKDNIDRIEICSFGEYKICKENMCPSNKMVISGVNKNYEEINYIIENEDNILRYTIESINQFKLLLDLSSKYKRKINIMPRLTSGNQFGITYEELEYIIENKNEFMFLSGIEYFSGTQKSSLKRIEKELVSINEHIKEIENKYKITINEIEYGPGLKVNYFIDEEFDEEEYLKEISLLIKNNLSNKKVILEIGRSIVASSGYYLTKVADLKENKTGKYAILDGGINHLVYYGGSMGMRIPEYEVLNKNKEEDIVNLFGSLCTINDCILKCAKTPKLEINDTFIFKNVGAYSVTEGINLFLSRDMPKVLLISNNKEILVRDKFNTYKLNCPNYGGK